MTDSPTLELKVCPFCGTAPSSGSGSDESDPEWLGCMNPKCVVMPYINDGEDGSGGRSMAEIWNRRYVAPLKVVEPANMEIPNE